MILSVGHEKGGSGKTTLATNLAVWLSVRGLDVLLVDADRQANASRWAARRAEDQRCAAIPCVQATGNIRDTIRDLSRRYEHIVIDCRGTDGPELRSSLLVAHRLLVPARASEFDLEVLDHMSELVTAGRDLNPTLRAEVVLTMVSTNARVTEANEARAEVLSHDAFELMETVIYDRKAYRDASRGGWSVLEMDDAKAISELQHLGEELYGQVSQRRAAAV